MTAPRLALAWSAFVLLLCTIPGSTFTTPPFELISVDKLAHALLFGVFGILWIRALPERPWLILLVGIAFGVGIEIWQGLLPIGRAPEAADALADAVGLVVGIGIGRVWVGAR